MFKFRRKKNTFVTVRAEDLQFGDSFVYDSNPVSVLTKVQDSDQVSLILDVLPADRPRYNRMVFIPRELLITVLR